MSRLTEIFNDLARPKDTLVNIDNYTLRLCLMQNALCSFSGEKDES